MTRGRKRTDLINQIFIGLALMRSRVKHGNRIVSTLLLFYYFLLTSFSISFTASSSWWSSPFSCDSGEL
ncbi:hypothetical protein B5F96_15500 [Parabacteroides johnsonii]|uniref:Uncharacterized protein n=1 Tax=Parabacteroides johnsonii TaxID=387661 RepID=A0A9Q5X6X2_9BACT|nr:hypothetical protein B5F96_15500 [Parabacteroides johnsonii]